MAARPRNYSVNQRLRQLAAEHKPRFHFAGKNSADWKAWRDELLPALKYTLGVMPERTPLCPEILSEWKEDGLIKQKVAFDVEPNLSVTAYVFRPEHAQGRLPAIFACHGHGSWGKDAIMGIHGRAEIERETKEMNCDYGLKMAQAGYAVIAIDWRGFNDRDDRRKPHCHDIIYGRDPCNVYYLLAQLLGQTLLGQHIHDGQATLNYLADLDFVDPQRIGIMGLSFGGLMAIWLSMLDDRIRATNILCYSEHYAEFGLRYANLCGSQITPGLFTLCDISDLQGLIAPRPLLVEIASQDEGFFIESSMNAYREVQAIYRAAGAIDKLDLDLFGGHHRWNGAKSVGFFAKALGR